MFDSWKRSRRRPNGTNGNDGTLETWSPQTWMIGRSWIESARRRRPGVEKDSSHGDKAAGSRTTMPAIPTPKRVNQ
jgi:hypothetical protein